MKMSDAKMIKNSRRSAQHQLRDHLEVIGHELDHGWSDPASQISNFIQTYVCWPFLSSRTKDPRKEDIPRWKDEAALHVFKDSFKNKETFSSWFKNTVLGSQQQLPRRDWFKLLQRFIILSCGVFLEELNEGLLVLLTQQQLRLLHTPTFSNGKALIVHGAAGTGKTMLVLQRLRLLYLQGKLHDHARALYICYWPGIRCDVQQKLSQWGIERFVDTARFYITLDSFLQGNKSRYRYVFMDEAEALCLAFDERIIQNTFEKINSVRDMTAPGSLWFMVDINQAAIFLPKHSPNKLSKPDVVLTKVMRCTGNVYQLFYSYYKDPFPALPAQVKKTAYMCIEDIQIGHNIAGPPIYWVQSEGAGVSVEVASKVVIDLCARKGIQANDICVFPFFITDQFLQNNVNTEIQKHFVADGFMPQAMCHVESFLLHRQPNHFLIPWVLRCKGLEFKVVVLVLEDEDVDLTDAEDRRKLYIMASRCTCMLVVVCSQHVKTMIDVDGAMRLYPGSFS